MNARVIIASEQTHPPTIVGDAQAQLSGRIRS
jgi:hypothetical protein